MATDRRLVHSALADLNRIAATFRAEEGLDSGFSFETEPELGRSVLDLDIEGYVEDFGRVTAAYGAGVADSELPADAGLARSLIPPGTGALRDFSYVGTEIPVLDADKCVACMECVTECPDTAILGKVASEEAVDADGDGDAALRSHWARTRKFWDKFERDGAPGLFGIFIDPTKCKGCAECVDVCGEHDALRMVTKSEASLGEARAAMEQFHRLPDTDARYVREKIPVDRMLAGERCLLYVGGAGSCAGCGEANALRMLVAQLGWRRGRNGFGLVAATGCNTVYSSTYPYNPFLVPWTNSLFENAPAVAMGVRKRWDQGRFGDRSVWAIGGDGAIFDIGFGSLSRLFASGMNVNVFVLDTQVYSNTGGQASTASFTGQAAKMAPHGSVQPGKLEARKDIATIAMMHPDVYVAQTTAAHFNHFYRAVEEADAYDGPSLVVVYSTCQPEHGVADDASTRQAKLAVESRAFPLLVHDPRRGESLRERLDLKGNPSPREDWHTDPKSEERVDFVTFARSEGRFRRQFDREGTPSSALETAQSRVLSSWRRLQELSGLR